MPSSHFTMAMANRQVILGVCLILSMSAIYELCLGGGVISVVAPPLVNSPNTKRRIMKKPMKASSPINQWWYGALNRGCEFLNWFVDACQFVVVTHTKVASEQEYELNDFLFNRQGYNPLIRPVANISDALRVDLGLCMIQLIHIVSRNLKKGFCFSLQLAIKLMERELNETHSTGERKAKKLIFF